MHCGELCVLHIVSTGQTVATSIEDARISTGRDGAGRESCDLPIVQFAGVQREAREVQVRGLAQIYRKRGRICEVCA